MDSKDNFDKEYKNNNYLFNKEYSKDLLKDKKTAKDLNKNLIDIINKNIENVDYSYPDVYTAYFEVKYPGILVGLGYPHELAGIADEEKLKNQISNGFSFDYVTGMPYIPGSTIKGIIRHVFDNALHKEEDRDKENSVSENYIEYIKSKNNPELTNTESESLEEFRKKVEEYRKKHFGGAEGKGSDIFYDAQVIGMLQNSKVKNAIGMENITPHSEGPLKNPKPISLLKIMPGIVIRVSIKTDKESFNMFKSILEDMGIGAKTNVGFGVIEEIAQKQNVVFGEIDCENDKNANVERCIEEKTNNRNSNSATNLDMNIYSKNGQITNDQTANHNSEESNQKVITAKVSNVTKWGDVFLIPDEKNGIMPNSRIKELSKKVEKGSTIKVKHVSDTKVYHEYELAEEEQ